MSFTVLNPDEYASLEHRLDSIIGEERLVKRAGAAAAEEIRQRIPSGSTITILAGPGNNGGDAIACALSLQEKGFVVQLVIPGGRRPTSATTQSLLQEWRARGQITFDDPYMTRKARCVVDGLFGLRQTKAVQGDELDAVLWFNERQALKVALDVPTGLNAYTGQRFGSMPVIRADVTITFLATKSGFYMEEGVDACGEIVLKELDVSVPLTTVSVVDTDEFTHVLHPRLNHSHKGHYGHVLVVGGETGKVGAALLAARSALRMGAGRVTVEFIEPNALVFDPMQPELMFSPTNQDEDYDVVIVGPGLGQSDKAKARVARALEKAKKLVLDADALNIIAADLTLQDALLARTTPTILTPHEMEAARLLRRDVKDVCVDRLAAARELAVQTGAVVVLKGPGTVTTLRSSRAWINPTGNAMLATAGSGDVLSGMIASLFAQQFDIMEATLAAIWLHGMAVEGRYAGVVADEIAIHAADILEEMRWRHRTKTQA